MKGVRVSDGESVHPNLPALFIPESATKFAPCLYLYLISIKREIGHLCHDESKPGKQDTTAQPQTTAPAPASLSLPSASGMSTSFGFHTFPCTSPRPLFLHATEHA